MCARMRLGAETEKIIHRRYCTARIVAYNRSHGRRTGCRPSEEIAEMTKFERAAARIAKATGLHVEFSNGEYIV